MCIRDRAQIVLDVLDRDGICFSRREYVQKKYEESAPVFLSLIHI